MSLYEEKTMDEKTYLALETAEKSYIYYRYESANENDLPDHILALNALFESFIHYGFAVSQIGSVIESMDAQSYLFETLIEPHLRIVDDISMIAKQYVMMYVQYIAQLAQGMKSEEAVKTLFA
jgi:hypothetical protein